MDEIALKLTIPNLTQSEKDELLSDIELTRVEIQTEPNRVVGVHDILEIIIIAVVGKVAEKTTEGAMNQLGEVIKEWRRKRRKSGKPIEGQLEASNCPPLNLKTVTDKEIEEWLASVKKP